MEVICIHSSFVHLCFGTLVRPAWICIQPQSRRSPRCYITIIIRAPSRVFQFQDSQHSFQDCMDYTLPGLHWKRFTTPCRIAYTAPSTAVAFPYLTASDTFVPWISNTSSLLRLLVGDFEIFIQKNCTQIYSEALKKPSQKSRLIKEMPYESNRIYLSESWKNQQK